LEGGLLYFNEDKKALIASKEIFGRKIANNLQNYYIRYNNLLTQNLENKKCPNKFLDAHDHSWMFTI
jgi:hypothetical protein